MSNDKSAEVVVLPRENDEESKEPVLKNQFDLSTFDIDSPVCFFFRLGLLVKVNMFQEIDLTHTRADHIPDLTGFPKIEVRILQKYVCKYNDYIQELRMRNNLLVSISPTISSLVTLTSLDLYENQLTEISHLESLVNLVSLDLSYNR